VIQNLYLFLKFTIPTSKIKCIELTFQDPDKTSEGLWFQMTPLSNPWNHVHPKWVPCHCNPTLVHLVVWNHPKRTISKPWNSYPTEPTAPFTWFGMCERGGSLRWRNCESWTWLCATRLTRSTPSATFSPSPTTRLLCRSMEVLKQRWDQFEFYFYLIISYQHFNLLYSFCSIDVLKYNFFRKVALIFIHKYLNK